MLTRAKFLRLSGVAAAALAVAPEALAKSNDGVVRVKSIYSFQETIERLKKDTAADIRYLIFALSPLGNGDATDVGNAGRASLRLKI